MKQLKSCAAILLIVCAVVPSLFAALLTPTSQTKSHDEYSAKLRAFEQFVEAQMKKDRIPGLTIGFSKGKYTWVKGFGYADLENKSSGTAESAYRLASITKSMTGTAILQLVERGKIKLDEEIQTYVPSYPKQKWPVTVRQLLVHLGGGQTGSGIGPEYVTPREVVARIARYPIKNEPGVKFDYQTSGYNLLGAAIEEVTGKSFGEYLRENIWLPAGMKDTRMDNVRELIPNRVRGYELVKGEIRNAPFLDVSSRFGGGGATGTVPDLLRWADSVQTAGILSKASLDLMFSPVANKSGHFVGIDDDAWHYTLGWQVFPVNGQFIFYQDGGQIGTNTMVFHLPSENLSIAFACNLQDIDRMPYVKRLYEMVTDQPWDNPVYTTDKSDDALYRALNSTFNWGSLHYDQTKEAYTNDPQELATAFAYFNKFANRDALRTAFEETRTAINDGRHPVASLAFVKVGSYMAMALSKKYGVERVNSYHTNGAIPFFADYIAMYKANSAHASELRFSEPFEKLFARWNQDWTRTWNDYTRRFSFTAGSDLNNINENFARLFTGAEIYPNLIKQLLELRQSFEERKDLASAVRVAKIAAERYPQSDTTNTYYAISLVLIGRKDEARESLKRAAGINSKGIAGAGTVNQIALALSGIGKLDAAIDWLEIAIEIYPREARLYGTFGDVYSKQGRREQSIEAYKKAPEIDPAFEHAREMLKKEMP